MIEIQGLNAIEKTCNLGHLESPRLLWSKNGFDYLQCPACKLVWVNPQLTDQSVERIYHTIFGSKFVSNPLPNNFIAYKARLNGLKKYKQFGRLLDVGCFTGNFLLAAKNAGWENVEGTEISRPAVEYARQNNSLVVYEGDLLTLDLPEEYFDAITLSDVIEHVSDPLATMKKIHKILRPGGVLYMDTPHFNSIPQWFFGKDWSVFFPWHRTYFSAKNMNLALKMAGFKVKKLQTVGILPFSKFNAWDHYQLSLISSLKQNETSKNTRNQMYRDLLRPVWLGVKRATEIPFEISSLFNIHIGAKLVVYAEKSED